MRSRKGKRTRLQLAAWLVTAASSTACASWPAERTPRLSKPLLSTTVVEPVAIRLVVDDYSPEPRPMRISRALDRSRKRFPYLSSASEELVNPDYTIELSVEHSLKPSQLNALSYYSFLLFPAFFSEAVSVKAEVADSDNRTLGIFQSTGRRKVVMQMHLLWVLPVATPLMPYVERKMWNNTFRDVLIQAGELIATEARRVRRPLHPGS